LEQSTGAEISREEYRKPTRREGFLDKMNHCRTLSGTDHRHWLFTS